MRIFFKMVEESIENDLANRLAINLTTKGLEALEGFKQIESEINMRRSKVHSKIIQTKEK